MYKSQLIGPVTDDGTFERPPMVDAIRADLARSNARLQQHGLDQTIYMSKYKSNILLVKTAADWLLQEQGKPMPNALFGDFWLEGELCILFADTNLGKSILAVQIGAALAAGSQIEPFNNHMPNQTPVLYIDFEMGSKQFESRYTHPTYGGHRFSNTFYRAEFNPQADNPALYDDFNDYLADALQSAINTTRARVVIIDNLTYMRSGTERAKDALPLMKQLKALKTKNNLSVLALAHTPKRSPFMPITVNDLQGSKMIINFCDSAFAIGESHTVPGGRYLKQIKQRNTRKLYHQDNVALCHIEKQMNMLRYVFDGFDRELHHLKKSERVLHREPLKQEALDFKKRGFSLRRIAALLNISTSTVSRLLAQETPHPGPDQLPQE